MYMYVVEPKAYPPNLSEQKAPATTKQRQPLIDSDDEEGDLFGSAPEPSSQPVQKKPVGGVSMFGANFKPPTPASRAEPSDTVPPLF